MELALPGGGKRKGIRMTTCKSPKASLRSPLWPEGSEKSVWPLV